MAEQQQEQAMRPWPADKVERWSLDRIQPYPRNARLHSEEQVEQIAASMRKFGVTAPVLVDEEGVLIFGHGRLRAAQKLGLAELPVSVAVGWPEEDKRAYRITDNQLALNSEWDLPALKLELQELKLADFDMPLLGFNDLKLVEFMAHTGTAREITAEQATTTLAERFGVAPFSVLNAREGWWQERKRAWIALGIQSELGRGENLIGRSPQGLFCHLTGIPYGEARKIVEKALAEATPNEPMDLMALVRKHGGPRAHPGAPGNSNFARSGAVMPVRGGDVKHQLLKVRGYLGGEV